MIKIRRFPGLYWLVAMLALLVATLGCKECKHDCECDCSEPEAAAGGEGGETAAGGDGGEAGGGVVLRPIGAELDEDADL